MLVIKKYDTENNYRTLKLDDGVFHRALDYVKRGEERFHVETGTGDRFDLEFVSNVKWTLESKNFPDNPLFREKPFYPEYYDYDETDREKLSPEPFEGYERVVFEEANEYTVVLARLARELTGLKVEFLDGNIKYFPDLAGCYVKSDGAERADDGKTLLVKKELSNAPFIGKYSTVDSVGLFHNVFIYQWLTPLPMKAIKYLEIMVAKSEGIGSILMLYGRTRLIYEKLGWQVVIKPGSSRYPDSFLQKYFNITMTPPDSDETNTICLTNYYSLLFTRAVRDFKLPEITEDAFKARFLSDMKEYQEAVFAGKRVLGILLRGSDYITTEMSGTSAPIKPEVMFSKIHEWMDEEGFDKIFLATEDQDML